MEQTNNNESKIRKVLFNEISLCIAGIGLVSSGIFWVTNPQQEMQIQIVKLQAQIESNQTVTTELLKIKNNDLYEMNLRLEQIENRQIELLKAMARIEAVHTK